MAKHISGTSRRPILEGTVVPIVLRNLALSLISIGEPPLAENRGNDLVNEEEAKEREVECREIGRKFGQT